MLSRGSRAGGDWGRGGVWSHSSPLPLATALGTSSRASTGPPHLSWPAQALGRGARDAWAGGAGELALPLALGQQMDGCGIGGELGAGQAKPVKLRQRQLWGAQETLPPLGSQPCLGPS